MKQRAFKSKFSTILISTKTSQSQTHLIIEVGQPVHPFELVALERAPEDVGLVVVAGAALGPGRGRGLGGAGGRVEQLRARPLRAERLARVAGRAGLHHLAGEA